MKYSIIIPSRNATNLERCIAAIRDAGDLSRIIVVWDTTPTPGVSGPEVASYHALGAYSVFGVAPFCFGRNINIGIQSAESDDVILLNDDALLKDSKWPVRSELGFNGFRAMSLAFYYRDHNFGLVSATIQGPAHPVHMERESPDPLPDVLAIDRIRMRMVPFVCVFIPRSTIDRVGMLDERFFGTADGQEVYGGEDDEYCYRVREAGFDLGVYGGCLVNHGTLPSTFRPDGKGRSLAGARARFREIHGFEMGSR